MKKTSDSENDLVNKKEEKDKQSNERVIIPGLTLSQREKRTRKKRARRQEENKIEEKETNKHTEKDASENEKENDKNKEKKFLVLRKINMNMMNTRKKRIKI